MLFSSIDTGQRQSEERRDRYTDESLLAICNLENVMFWWNMMNVAVKTTAMGAHIPASCSS